MSTAAHADTIVAEAIVSGTNSSDTYSLHTRSDTCEERTAVTSGTRARINLLNSRHPQEDTRPTAPRRLLSTGPAARCTDSDPTSARTPARRRALIPDNGLVLEITREAFEELVSDALDRIPPELTRVMDNVAIFVEDEPTADDPELLGLYEGSPLTERGEWYAGMLPDRITIYRGPTLRMCATPEEIVNEVTTTVIHEVAHHFGIDDARLHELGWG